MAVEEPHAGVVSLEAQDNVAIGPQDEGVPAHGNGRVVGLCRVGRVEDAGLFVRPCNGLEVMAVQMERVLSGVWSRLARATEVLEVDVPRLFTTISTMLFFSRTNGCTNSP